MFVSGSHYLSRSFEFFFLESVVYILIDILVMHCDKPKKEKV